MSLQEQLAEIAQRLAAITGDDERAWVQMFLPPTIFAELPGVETRSTCYVYEDRPPQTIDTARLEIGVVEFKTQTSRPATQTEIAEAEGESGIPYRVSYRSTKW